MNLSQNRLASEKFVIPAEAGIQNSSNTLDSRLPAGRQVFTGMTAKEAILKKLHFEIGSNNSAKKYGEDIFIDIIRTEGLHFCHEK